MVSDLIRDPYQGTIGSTLDKPERWAGQCSSLPQPSSPRGLRSLALGTSRPVNPGVPLKVPLKKT